ncbi:hypothetical protein GOV12_05705 [Candidatus Pacearchaeota archaeon]|nr:hypothetical protein [Candidatus Pacearchaeota archaeon]
MAVEQTQPKPEQVKIHTVADANRYLKLALETLKEETRRFDQKIQQFRPRFRTKDSNLDKDMRKANLKEDYEALDAFTRQTNRILYRAIQELPCDTNAVRIPITIDPNRDASVLPNDFKGRSERKSLTDFFKVVCDVDIQDLSKPFEFTFIKNLPFSFTTGTHGSGERDAAMSSCPNLSFKTSSNMTNVPAYLAIDSTDFGMLKRNDMYLLLDEVNSISLVNAKKGDLTTRAMEEGNDLKLIDPRTPETHYLNFRRFKGYRFCIDKDTVQEDIDKEVYEKVRKICLPENGTGLFVTSFGSGTKSRKLVSFRGFAADISNNDPVLYEFDNVSFPDEIINGKDISLRNPLSVAYRMLEHEKTPQPNIQTYSGQEIIRRLSEHQVSTKFD